MSLSYDYNLDDLDGVDYAEAIEYLAEYDRISRERWLDQYMRDQLIIQSSSYK